MYSNNGWFGLLFSVKILRGVNRNYLLLRHIYGEFSKMIH